MQKSLQPTASATTQPGGDALPVSKDPTGEFPFNVDDYLFHLLVAAGRTRDAQLDQVLRGIGLNVGQHRALGVLARFEPCAMSTLADVSRIDRTTLTRVVDTLVEAGLVSRAKTPSDRRQVILATTDAGRACYVAACRLVADHNRYALEGIPDEAKRAMVRTSQMLVANLAPDARIAEQLLTMRMPSSEAG